MWLDFFHEKGHRIEESASLIPNNDPTLLWINAGVAAMKKYFDGSEKPVNPRMVNSIIHDIVDTNQNLTSNSVSINSILHCQV